LFSKGTIAVKKLTAFFKVKLIDSNVYEVNLKFVDFSRSGWRLIIVEQEGFLD